MASTPLPSPTLPQEHSELEFEDKEYEFSIPPFNEFELHLNLGPEPLVTPPANQKPEWVSGVKLLNIVAAVTLVCLLMLLDSSIIVTAIPRSTSDFQSLPDVGWYGSAHQLARYAMVT